MQLVKFPTDIYDNGIVKFAEGSYHPLNSETQSLVAAGYADLIDDDTSTDHATLLQARARISREGANAAMAQALELAAAADEAEQLAEIAAGLPPRRTDAEIAALEQSQWDEEKRAAEATAAAEEKAKIAGAD